MTKKTGVSILKPDLGAALDFATGSQKEASGKTLAAGVGSGTARQEKQPKRPSKQVSGLVPEGDVRLTANISEEHHIKLKIAAAQQRTTIGELIEKLIDEGL